MAPQAATMCTHAVRARTVGTRPVIGKPYRGMSVERAVRRRRAAGLVFLACLIFLDFFSTGLFGGRERTLAIVRSIILPGLPFVEWFMPIGLVTVSFTLFAIFAWLRWGMDWLPIAVMIVCVSIAALITPPHHSHVADNDQISVLTASHEFTLVLVLFGLASRARQILNRIPGMARLGRLLPDSLTFPAVDVAREMILRLAAGSEPALIVQRLPLTKLLARARRINGWARFRWRGDCPHRAHGPLRAMMLQAGLLNEAQTQAFVAECRRSLSGVPDSEPTWVRPLDGMLAALALDALGEQEAVQRWLAVFGTQFRLQHGRRAAALHSPSMIAIGTSPLWQHAASTAIARRMGWLETDEDWDRLRSRCLGVAASGSSAPESLRFIAAGGIWATLTHDSEAVDILARRTLTGDGLAEALVFLKKPGVVDPVTTGP